MNLLHLEMSSMCYMKILMHLFYLISMDKMICLRTIIWPSWSLVNLGVSFNTTDVMKSLLMFWTSLLRKYVTSESLPKHTNFSCLSLVSHYDSITTIRCGPCNSVETLICCYKLWYPSWLMGDTTIRNSDIS